MVEKAHTLEGPYVSISIDLNRFLLRLKHVD